MYADGYILPIRKKNIDAYRKLARKAGKIWRERGALDYKECVGDDFKGTPFVPFPVALKLKPGETVVFAWVLFKSRVHRDKVNKKVMTDPRIAKQVAQSMPFDHKRMLYGGFKVMVG